MGKILVCNQKMFLTYDEAKELRNELIDYNNDNLIIAPNFLNMKLYKDFNLCAQNCHYEVNGAYTGEVSCYHLNLIGVRYVLIGHSERRIYDDDKIINKKVRSALANALIPIICIGESYLDNQMCRTSRVLKKQIIEALKDVDLDSEIVIAYEPTWVIGKKITLNKTLIEDASTYIKKVLKELGYNNYKLLYGGSVSLENIKSIVTDEVDGYLLGSSSCNINEIKDIIKCINNVN